MIVLWLAAFLAIANCGPAADSFKDQYCTDPRTMRKHAAYTEWADAYSCTRHRCQPGGRNLAIYTVGCKRVEAPESAIECEEVVEDTNMQFPFCCTRLRCLVVVRGEVWTRVLGQPWETLPAAPWSHMYKMKKPPPTDRVFTPKSPDQGPIYELSSDVETATSRKMLRASPATTEDPDCNKAVPKPGAAPDIVIALSTSSDPKDSLLSDALNRRKRVHKEVARSSNYYVDDRGREKEKDRSDTDHSELDETSVTTERHADGASDERSFGKGNDGPPHKSANKHSQSWIPQNQWNEREPAVDTDNNKEIPPYNQQDLGIDHKAETEKPSNLQALVDAIGSRMRDIEHVVQKMTVKVHQPVEEVSDKETASEDEASQKRHKLNELMDYGKAKRPGPDDQYRSRFSVRNRGSKYLHSMDSTTEQPLFVEDAKLTGYYSDASNSVLKRSKVQNPSQEPVETYMAPVDTRRKSPHSSDTSDEKKHKKNKHKKKKGKHHKKHRGKKRFNKLSSTEVDKNTVSLEDNSAGGAT